jgi:putative salt-induced outer membrane protein
VYVLRFIVPCILALACAGGAHADSIFPVLPPFPADLEDEEAPDDGLWAGHFAAGYSANTGNTENSTLNARLLVGYMRARFRHAINIVGNRTTDAIGTTGERTVFAGKTDYRLGEFHYLFLTAQWERDRFAGFDRRTSEAFGYGRHLVDTDRHQVDGEVGVGARQVHFVNGNRENVAILRLAGSWRWNVSESTEFTTQVTHEHGRDNSYTESEAALKTNLIGSLFSSLSYAVKHNSDTQPGIHRTDTRTMVQLEFRF